MNIKSIMGNVKMTRVSFFLTILTIVSCDFKSSEDYHNEAKELEKLEKYTEAIVLLDKSIEKNPENITALLDRAFDKSEIKDYKGALADNSRVIELDPKNGLALLNRGKEKINLGDYNAAIKDFDEAISTKGGESVYMNKVENSFVETGFEFDVKMEEIRLERGIAYYYIDSLKRAFDDFNFSMQKNYLLSDCYYYRGLIYLRYNMKSEGCIDLNKARELGATETKDIIDQYCK